VPAIDHETDECGHADAPDDGQDVKGIHGVPPEDECPDPISHTGSQLREPGGVGGAGKQNYTPRFTGRKPQYGNLLWFIQLWNLSS
jgi:hypothetical protein